MLIYDMLRRSRALLDEVLEANDSAQDNSSGTAWTNRTLMGFLNAAQDHYVGGALNRNPNMWVKYALLSYVAAQELYDLPRGLDRLLAVYRTDKSGASPLFPIPIDMRWAYDKSAYVPMNLLGLREWTYRSGLKLGVLPKPTAAASDVLRIEYAANIPEFHYGYVQSGSSVSLVMASGTPEDEDPHILGGELREEDDYYNGAQVRIIGGTGTGQLRTIDDFVGSTRTCTLDSALTTELDTTSVYQIDPIMPENHHLLLVYRAAWEAQAAKQRPAEYLSALLQGAIDEFEDWLESYAGRNPVVVAPPSAFVGII